MKPVLFIGMISGTSRDGVDAALVKFEGGQPEVLKAICMPYPADLAESLQDTVMTGQRPDQNILGELDQKLAEHFSRTVIDLLKSASVNPQEIRAIGSHGQTVWHDPDGPEPETIQLGSPHLIARQTGIITIGDFRRADMAAGGQGAPLAPLLHRALFAPSRGDGPGKRVVLNLGGIANISILDDAGNVSGFDTGPANCLLDAWIQKHQGALYDRNGEWSASGEVAPGLLEEMLVDSYFQKPAPKSTGVEYFNLSWLAQFSATTSTRPRDVQATLAELTAVTVAEQIRPHQPGDVLVCGGGAHNPDLWQRLHSHLPGVAIRPTADLGLDPDWIEAVLFAWLAQQRLDGQALDTRSITGAAHPVMLGMVANPR